MTGHPAILSHEVKLANILEPELSLDVLLTATHRVVLLGFLREQRNEQGLTGCQEGHTVPGKRHMTCKALEVGWSLLCLRKSWSIETEKESRIDEGGKVAGPRSCRLHGSQ